MYILLKILLIKFEELLIREILFTGALMFTIYMWALYHMEIYIYSLPLSNWWTLVGLLNQRNPSWWRTNHRDLAPWFQLLIPVVYWNYSHGHFVLEERICFGALPPFDREAYYWNQWNRYYPCSFWDTMIQGKPYLYPSPWTPQDKELNVLNINIPHNIAETTSKKHLLVAGLTVCAACAIVISSYNASN